MKRQLKKSNLLLVLAHDARKDAILRLALLLLAIDATLIITIICMLR